MISKRLKAIADLVPSNKSVIDIGTDHAYLPIYLYQNKITQDVAGSDISVNVLKYSLNNLKKYQLETKIPLLVSDGFKNIPRKFAVAILAGMGTRTIIDILNTAILPDILIIQSNNEHYLLRTHMNKIGYKISREVVIKDKKHYYVIIKYEKGKEVLSDDILLFGKSNNLEYYQYLLAKYEYIYNQAKDSKYLVYMKKLNSIIEKIPV